MTSQNLTLMSYALENQRNGEVNNEQKRKSPAAEATGLDGIKMTHGNSLLSHAVYVLL